MYAQAASHTGPAAGDSPAAGKSSGPSPGSGEGQAKQGEVIDAEYVDMDENKEK